MLALILLFSFLIEFGLSSYQQINETFDANANINLNQTGIRPFIKGGRDAYLGEAPYMAAIWDVKSRRFICAATIINRWYLLSAAHCFIGIPKSYHKNIKIHYGDMVTTKDKAVEEGEPIRDIITHENYNAKEYYHDIAIIISYAPLTLNRRTADMVTLPELDNNLGDEDRSEHAKVSGWGYQGIDQISTMLQVVTLPIIARRVCQERYKNDVSKTNSITRYQICAGYFDNRKGVCTRMGDSGNPLTYDGELIGIASLGSSCLYPQFPGIFTKVSSYLHWMKKYIRELH